MPCLDISNKNLIIPHGEDLKQLESERFQLLEVQAGEQKRDDGGKFTNLRNRYFFTRHCSRLVRQNSVWRRPAKIGATDTVAPIDDFQKMPSTMGKCDGVKIHFKGQEETLTPPVFGAGDWQSDKTKFEDLLAGLTLKDFDFDSMPTIELNDNHFEQIPSLSLLRQNTKNSLCIGFDTEWSEKASGERIAISYQFSLVIDDILFEYVVYNNQGEDGRGRLSIQDALGLVLSDLEPVLTQIDYSSMRASEIRRHRVCVGFKSVDGLIDQSKPIYEWSDGRAFIIANSFRIHPYFKTADGSWEVSERTVDELHEDGVINKYQKSVDHIDIWKWSRKVDATPSDRKLSITLIGHFGRVDFSMFAGGNEDGWDNLLRKMTSIQGGVDTMLPFTSYLTDFNKSGKNKYVYPVSVQVRDTISQTVGDNRSLDGLGKILGLPKLDDPNVVNNKGKMNWVLANYPVLFDEYARRDSTVTLLHYASLYGHNKRGYVALTSASAHIFRERIFSYLSCEDDDEFERKYRGFERISDGKEFSDDYKTGCIQMSKLEPISENARDVQDYCSRAYHGGYNACFEVGWFEGLTTYDLDLCSAYPTAMCNTVDIDWEDPILMNVIDKDMSLKMFKDGNEFNPFKPFVGRVTFEFPDSVYAPSIPIADDGSLIYPLESKREVYATGVEIFVALRLGAKVHCDRGMFLNPLFNENNEPSYSLRYAVKELLKDRKLAKDLFGKKNLEDLIMKVLANAGYGKVSQNVKPKSTWSARSREMEDLGCSSITNPYLACMITSIVRAELLAVINEIRLSGHHVYSCTTDGFITDMPCEKVEKLDMLGLAPLMRQARLTITSEELVPSSKVWEEKHRQDHLLNLTTRGNMGLESGGVSAHNSTRSPYDKSDPDYDTKDRMWFIIKSLTREDRVAYQDRVFTQFKELVEGKDHKVTPVVRKVSMDFDMKRKPNEKTCETVYPVIDGKTYEICNLDTLPYKNIDESRTYRHAKSTCVVLRTRQDWSKLFIKARNPYKRISKDINWDKLLSVIMGYRANYWDIPALHDKSLSEKFAWINSLGITPKEFKECHWKNCRRAERLSAMIDPNELQDLFEIMGVVRNERY